MRIAKLSACGLAAAGLFGCAFGQISKTKDGKYSFRTHYAPGMVINYDTQAGEATPSGALGDTAISIPIELKVLSNKGLKATIRITTGPGTLAGTKVIEKSSIDVPMDNRNTTVGKGGGLTPQFPLAPIGIGATWKAMMPLKLAGGMPAKLEATYRFLGVKAVGSQNLAVISFDMSGPAEGAGTMYVRTGDGTLESYELNVRPTVGPSRTARVHLSVRRKASSMPPAGKPQGKRKKQ